MMALSATPMRRIVATALPIDLDRTICFLRSVSTSIVMQRNTRAVWKDDAGTIKYLYMALFGLKGAPGTVQIETASKDITDKAIEVDTLHRVDTMLNKANAGPAALTKYLFDQGELRRFAFQSMAEQRQDAGKINEEVAAAWGETVVVAATTKLVATCVLKGLGQIPGPGWAYALGYDIAVKTVEDLSSPGDVQAVAMVSSAAAEAGLGELRDHVAEKTISKVLMTPTEKELSYAFAQMRRLENKLADQMGRLARHQQGIVERNVQSISALERHIPCTFDKVNVAQKTFVTGAGKTALSKAVGWLFLAKDIKEAFAKHEATIMAARQ